MKNIKRLLFVVAVTLTIQVNAGIKEDFFISGLSAKALALGGTAFAFGVDSLYSNPAGLAVMPDEYFSYSYKNSFDNLVDMMTFQYMRPHKRGAWGVGLIYMNNGNIDKTEINEFDRPEVVGKYGEAQTGISLAYAFPLWGNSALGFGARYYNNQIDTEQASSLGFFAGYIKKLKRNWLFGISLNNFSISQKVTSTPIHWSTGHTDHFPMRISTSLAHRRYFFEKQTEMFVDWHVVEVNESGDTDSRYSLGALVWFVPKIFSSRFGLSDEIVSFGMGLRMSSVGIDYAFLDHRYLGTSHYVSVSYKL